MDSLDLHTLEESVVDEDTFLTFLAALASDREDEVAKEQSNSSSPYSAGANGWENGSIEGFLEAASAWAETSKHGMNNYEPPKNPWKRIAQILHMGKHYE